MSARRNRVGRLRDRIAVVTIWLLWFCVLAFGAGLLALSWYFGTLRLG
ncbi:MAG TPA: hypothetical protein VGR91_12755 [Stellaceae bacterium]|nr:hypothetical protein [Stellaceae bacterium]